MIFSCTYIKNLHNKTIVGMLEKIEILIVIFVLLFVFYLVISLGASQKKKSSESLKIASYLYNVRILIAFIAIVALILWFFL